MTSSEPIFTAFAAAAASVPAGALSDLASFRAGSAVELFRGVLGPSHLDLAEIPENDPGATIFAYICARPTLLGAATGSHEIPHCTVLLFTTARARTLRLIQRSDTILIAVRRSALPQTPYFPAVLRVTEEYSAITCELLQRLAPTWIDGDDVVATDLSDREAGDVRRIIPTDVIGGGNAWEHAVLDFVSRSLGRTLIEELASPRLHSAVALIRAKSTDRSFTVDAVASAMHLSRRSVEALFAPQGGFARYLRRFRAEHAVRLIESGERDWSAVSGAVGFGSQRTMIRAISEFHELTPAEVAAGAASRSPAPLDHGQAGSPGEDRASSVVSNP